MLPPAPQRLACKRYLLSQFESEGGEQLVRFFGHPDLFRRIYDVDEALSELPRGYLSLGSRQVGISTLWVLLFFYSLASLVVVLLIRAIANSGIFRMWNA